MKKNSKKSTNKPRERPPRRRLYRTEGNTIFMTPELAKNVDEIFQELFKKFPELKKKARGEK